MKNGDVLDFGLSRIDSHWTTWTPPADFKFVAEDHKEIVGRTNLRSLPYALEVEQQRRAG